jgi:predicted SnoaL-like aldol condensation-catalyzing enzyme
VSLKENKTVVRRFVEEVFNQDSLAAVDHFLAADYRDANALPGQEPGREGAKWAFTLYRAVFPDLRYTIEEMIAEGDTVRYGLYVLSSPSWCPSWPGWVPASTFFARPPVCSAGGAAPGQRA